MTEQKRQKPKGTGPVSLASLKKQCIRTSRDKCKFDAALTQLTTAGALKRSKNSFITTGQSATQLDTQSRKAAELKLKGLGHPGLLAVLKMVVQKQ
jgi:hypothetical protein